MDTFNLKIPLLKTPFNGKSKQYKPHIYLPRLKLEPKTRAACCYDSFTAHIYSHILLVYKVDGDEENAQNQIHTHARTEYPLRLIQIMLAKKYAGALFEIKGHKIDTRRRIKVACRKRTAT